MSSNSVKLFLECLYKDHASEEVKSAIPLYAKKVSSELKLNRSKTAADINKKLHSFFSKNEFHSSNKEVLIYLLLLSKVRAIFNELNIQKKPYVNFSLEDRIEVLERFLIYKDSLPQGLSDSSSFLFLKAVLEDFAYNTYNNLLNFLSFERSFSEDSFLIFLEEGIASFGCSSSVVLQDEGLLDTSSKSHKELYCDFLTSRKLKALFQFSIEESYLKKYWPVLVLNARWAAANDCGLIVNFIYNDDQEVSLESRELLDLIVKANLYKDENSIRVYLEQVKNELYKKPYFASSRFLSLSDVSKEFNCPVFHPDAEALPVNNLDDFLKKVEGKSCVFGSSVGMKTIFPWRRWLASEFVVNSCNMPSDLITRFERGFHSSIQSMSWFVDQNVIFFIEQYCSQNNLPIAALEKLSSGHPVVQMSSTKEL